MVYLMNDFNETFYKSYYRDFVKVSSILNAQKLSEKRANELLEIPCMKDSLYNWKIISVKEYLEIKLKYLEKHIGHFEDEYHVSKIENAKKDIISYNKYLNDKSKREGV